jgi:hypothetical protein
MVEIEIGIFSQQCLDRRIDSYAKLIAETAAWEKRRNAERARINWMFTTENARTKLRRSYPKIVETASKKQRVITSCRGTSTHFSWNMSRDSRSG